LRLAFVVDVGSGAGELGVERGFLGIHRGLGDVTDDYAMSAD
jgi:hypothetical protein